MPRGIGARRARASPECPVRMPGRCPRHPPGMGRIVRADRHRDEDVPLSSSAAVLHRLLGIADDVRQGDPQRHPAADDGDGPTARCTLISTSAEKLSIWLASLQACLDEIDLDSFVPPDFDLLAILAQIPVIADLVRGRRLSSCSSRLFSSAIAGSPYLGVQAYLGQAGARNCASWSFARSTSGFVAVLAASALGQPCQRLLGDLVRVTAPQQAGHAALTERNRIRTGARSGVPPAAAERSQRGHPPTGPRLRQPSVHRDRVQRRPQVVRR